MFDLLTLVLAVGMFPIMIIMEENKPPLLEKSFFALTKEHLEFSDKLRFIEKRVVELESQEN